MCAWDFKLLYLIFSWWIKWWLPPNERAFHPWLCFFWLLPPSMLHTIYPAALYFSSMCCTLIIGISVRVNQQPCSPRCSRPLPTNQPIMPTSLPHLSWSWPIVLVMWPTSLPWHFCHYYPSRHHRSGNRRQHRAHQVGLPWRQKNNLLNSRRNSMVGARKGHREACDMDC